MGLLIECPDDVQRVLNLMRSEPANHKNPIAALGTQIDFVRSQYLRLAKARVFDWSGWFLHAGAVVLQLHPLDSKAESAFCSMLINKHRMYGVEPLTRWGSLGIVIRLDSKLQRYENIILSKNRTDEAEEDTLLDMIGYCVLGLIAAKKEL